MNRRSSANDPPRNVLTSPWVRLRAVRPGPFVFAKMVRAIDPAARPGDAVNVYDKSDMRLGAGLLNPRSQIVVRLLTTGTTPIDDAFWRGRLGQAVELRRRMRAADVTDAYRLVHAEGDGLSGLVVERYGDCLVFELFSLGMFQRVEQIAGVLGELLGPPTRLDRPEQAAGAWRVVVRADRGIERIEGFTVKPTADEPDELVIREHGIRYRVDVRGGHKTGFFCDQRENRRRLAGYCRDASVLDVCCYTGGFGLAAKILGGAREVTSIDLDETVVALARQNANLNNVRIHYAEADAFIYLRQMLAAQKRYDVLVLDPPKFVPNRDAFEEGRRKYHDLNKLAMQVLAPGGLLLTCSCSGLVSEDAFLDAVHAAGRSCGRALQLIDRSGAGADHPVMLDCPESAYLKAIWLRVW